MLTAKPLRSEEEFQDLLRRLKLALEASQIGVWEHNLKTDEILWDPQMHRIYETGATDRKMTIEQWLGAVHPEDRERADQDFERAVAARGLYTSEFRIVMPNGRIKYMRSRAHFYEDADGAPSFIGAEWDVTADVLLNRELERQRAVAEARMLALEESNSRIEFAADHDYLTGLANRRHFDRRLAQLRKNQAVETLAILHVDLDRFKQINDAAGHAAGDAVLRHAAAQITAAIPEHGIVARIGGDEFVIILINFGEVGNLRRIAENVADHLRRGMTYEQNFLQTGASIGISWSNDREAANLLAEADLALYQAKKLGRNRVEFFTPKMQHDLLSERRMTEELELALQRDEIVPFYQPQVDARTRSVVGLEALARWYHPVRGLLTPGLFLNFANEHGFSAEVDEAILKRVLQDRTFWALNGVEVPRIAVNISGSRLADPSLINRLQRLDIPRGALAFELVETIFLDDCDETVQSNIAEIKRMGIEIEIDDFGSGHASLIGLLQLRPKRLKIDRNLVIGVTTSPEQCRLVGAIVEIAKALAVEVVAEGVETDEHAQRLAQLGCDSLQGYAIGLPSPALDTFRMLLAVSVSPGKDMTPQRGKGSGGM